MTPTQIMTGQDAIVAEIEVAAPPERVFAALIDPKQLMQWWGGEGRWGPPHLPSLPHLPFAIT